MRKQGRSRDSSLPSRGRPLFFDQFNVRGATRAVKQIDTNAFPSARIGPGKRGELQWRKFSSRAPTHAGKCRRELRSTPKVSTVCRKSKPDRSAPTAGSSTTGTAKTLTSEGEPLPRRCEAVWVLVAVVGLAIAHTGRLRSSRSSNSRLV